MRLIAAVGLLVLLSGTDAHAQRRSPSVSAPFPTEPTALEIASLEVEIDCVDWKKVGLECQTSVTYAVVNPTADVVSVVLVVSSGLAKVSIDGARVKVRDGKLELSLDAGATGTMVTTKRVRMWPPRVFELPFLLRHMIFGAREFGALPAVRLPGVTSQRWAHIGEAVYTARYPTSLARLDGWDHADAGGRRVATARGGTSAITYFAPKRAPTLLGPVSGGPFLELGGTFGEGFRMALGYELGLNRWLRTSATAETHFDDVILTPAVEIGFWFPGFGAGLGAPVKVHPETEVGVRVQVTLVWLMGLVAIVDCWPDDEVWRTTLSWRMGI